VVFGLILRFLPETNLLINPNFYILLQSIVVINLGLAIFNLIPIPPLDGSHILFTFLPRSQNDFKVFLQRYGFIFLLFFIYFLLPELTPIIFFLYNLITGAPLQ
jgi:Zn-dependent protease